MSIDSERRSWERLDSILSLVKSQRGVLRFALLLVTASAVLTALLLIIMGAMEGNAVSMHFYVAFGLGSFLSLLHGFGLMSLVFYSARRGFDEPAEVNVAPAASEPPSRN